MTLKNKQAFQFVLGGCLLIFSSGVHAADLPSPIVPEKTPAPYDADGRLEEVTRTLADFKRETNSSLIRRFDEKGKPTMSMSRKDRQKKRYYLDLKKEAEFWGYVSALKNDLVNNYIAIHKNAPDDDRTKVGEEANQIAYSVVKGIEKLRDFYNIHTFPLVHNFIIDIGLASRGGCKHWAEDLLNVIGTVEHPHFTAFWAEAHPGKMSEHNVAVIAPRGASFDAGILIDPWRTAGEPYWSLVVEDSHPWRMWEGYNPR